MKYLFLLSLLLKLSTSVSLNEDTDDRPQYRLDLYEGDIVLDETQKDDLNARNARITAKKWPNGLIAYQIDSKSGYTSDDKATIISAMKTIEKETNGVLRFKERTNEKYYVRIKNTGDGCYSYVGRVKSAQTVSIDRFGCVYESTVMHELLHAAGFMHEQSRPDRDNYIEILYENMIPGARAKRQFEKLSNKQVSAFGQPYDIKSVMHYRYDAFSKNGLPTIKSKVSGVSTYDIGDSDDLSPIDIEKVKLFYNRASMTTLSSSVILLATLISLFNLGFI